MRVFTRPELSILIHLLLLLKYNTVNKHKIYWGILSRGILSGGVCPGGFCPDTIRLQPQMAKFFGQTKFGVHLLLLLKYNTVNKHKIYWGILSRGILSGGFCLGGLSRGILS